MGLERGTRIGEWIVEEPADHDDVFTCHRADTPFRKAQVREVQARDAAALQRETHALAHLDHPNIQLVLSLETHDDALYLVSETIQGTPLATFLRQPPLPLRASLDIAVQLTEALCTAHARGIQHRDVRPDHVWLSPDGRAVLAGFNLRNSLDPLDGPEAYLAPEAGRSSTDDEPRQVAEQRLDAYAFGVLLYELLSGERVAAHDAGTRTALSLGGDMPGPLRDLVASLTHPDPVARSTLAAAREILGLTLRESLGERVGVGAAEATYVDGDPVEGNGLPTPATIGRYAVAREIGRGGVGVVYEARDPGLQRRVALKVLLAGNFARARDIERFLREARAVAQLDHPNIVRILEFDREAGGAWFAMEYVEGPTLLQRIRDDGPLDWREAVGIAAKLARALHHAHRAGLLHRDVKPNNVLLEDGQRPRLTDFGLALSTDSADGARLTRTGQVLGTPMYMSPEQARGDLAAMGPHTDVYGVGVVLYEALTARVPFDGASPVAIIHKVLDEEAASPRIYVPQIPRDVEIACLKAMRKHPKHRYASALELAEDLERTLRGEPILAAAPSLLDRTRWFVRRHRSGLLASAAAGMAAALVATGGLAVWRGSLNQLQEQREQSASEALVAVMERIDQLEAEGQPGEATRAWTSFAAQPDYRRTHALVDGWLAWAARLAGDGDREGRLAALGTAYASATEQDQERTLLALAQGLRDEHQMDRLLAVVDTLRRRAPRAARQAMVQDLLRDALAAQRELDTAAEIGAGTPVGPVLEALSHATRTPHRADTAIAWPGPGAILALRRGNGRRLVLVDASPRLDRVREIRLGQPTREVFALAGDPARVLVARPGGGVLLFEEGVDGHLLSLGEWPGASLYAAASGDVDGDGQIEHYYGDGRHLSRLSGSGAPQWDQPHRGTEAASSEINDLAVADVDGDGDLELVVAAAEWGAYDVRVLGRGPGPELRLEGRLKLGVVADLAILPDPTGRATILADKRDRWANLRVFPADRPMGVAPGLWRMRVGSDGELDAVHLNHEICTDLTIGDLDGDGIMDAAARCGGDLMILVQDADGALHDVWLRQLTLLAMAQVDDDPALELIVADPADQDTVWVLGAGSARPPPLAQVAHAVHEPPDDAEPPFAASWRRAEDLAGLGRVEQAAHAMDELADQYWGRPVGRRALLRAADLHDARGAHGEAAVRYLHAAEGASEQDAWMAQRSAVTAFRADHDRTGEFGLLRAMAARGDLDPAEASRLAFLDELAARPAADVSFDEPLDPRWAIRDPLALMREPGSGLRFEAYGHGDLARLPVAWDGRGLGLRVDLAVDRTEWDGGVEIGLVPRDGSGRTFSVRLDGQGGGEVVERQLTCQAGPHGITYAVPASPDRLTVTLQVFAEGTGMACDATSDAWPPMRETKTEAMRQPDGPDWDLVIRASGRDDTLASGTLYRIRLEGAGFLPQLPSEPQDRPHAARLALVDGDAGTAAGLKASGSDLELEIAIAARRNDGPALRRGLRQAMSAGRADPVLMHLIHARLDTLGPELRAMLGADWPIAFAQAWGTDLLTHSTDPALVHALLRHVDGVEQVEPRDADEIPTLVLLNARRGAAAIVGARLDLADASLTRAIELYQRLGPSVAASLSAAAARVQLDRAEVAVLHGDPPEKALAYVEAGLRMSPAPEILADMAAARPGLAALRSLVAWQARVEPVRRGRLPIGDPPGWVAR